MEAPVVKLSLCLIVGNEADIIIRCLECFAPAFDELVVVQASGCLTSDRTIIIAGEWCAKNGKVFLAGNYLNGPGTEKWPHVDSFAAARNQAFSLATGDWLMWCDADDTIECAGQLRELAAKTKFDVLFFPYRVPGTDKAPIRERLFRRSFWEKGRRWHYAVHENLKLHPEDGSEVFMAPVWLHSPVVRTVKSHDRNLRILHKQVEDLGANCFYLHQELYLMGNKEAAKRFGEMALAVPALEPSFRYEILLNNSRMADNPRFKMEEAAKAFAVMPHCREAMAAMILTSFEVGDTGKAVALSERLIATPEPPIAARPWTHESKWYGWAGWDLRARVLRLAGRMEEAGYAQTMCSFGRPVITLIHLKGPDANRSYGTRSVWLNAAANAQRIQHVFGVVKGDPDIPEFLKQFEYAEGASEQDAWDEACAISRGHLLVQLCDGWHPCYAWDDELMAVLKASGKDVTTDPIAIRVKGVEMIVCSRRRWSDQGRKFFEAGFFTKAKGDGVLLEAPNIEFTTQIDPRGKGKGNPWPTSTSRKSTLTLETSVPRPMEEKPSCMPEGLQPFMESLPPKTPTSPLNSTVGMMTEPRLSISTEVP